MSSVGLTTAASVTRTGAMFTTGVRERAFEALRAGVMAATNQAANDVADLMPGLNRNFGVNTGALKDSILTSPMVSVAGPLVEGIVGSPLIYAPVIEDGRTPGKPISVEGVTNIGLWARRKLGITVGKAQTAAGQATNYFFVGFPIARGIKARGFAPPYQKGLGMFRNTIKYGSRAIENLLRAAVDRYAVVWGADNAGAGS